MHGHDPNQADSGHAFSYQSENHGFHFLLRAKRRQAAFGSFGRHPALPNLLDCRLLAHGRHKQMDFGRTPQRHVPSRSPGLSRNRFLVLIAPSPTRQPAKPAGYVVQPLPRGFFRMGRRRGQRRHAALFLPMDHGRSTACRKHRLPAQHRECPLGGGGYRPPGMQEP